MKEEIETGTTKRLILSSIIMTATGAILWYAAIQMIISKM